MDPIIYYAFGLSALSLGIFYCSFKRSSSSIINGFYFNIFLGSLALFSLVLGYDSNNVILKIPMFIVIAILMFGALFGFFILVIGLLLNARSVIKKEGVRLSNLLTLFSALGLIVVTILFPLLETQIPDKYHILHWLLFALTFLSFYGIFIFINFMTASILYSLRKPKPNADFIIVLGSGLKDGKTVPPLLAARINTALKYYEKCITNGYQPILIFSGGRGDDEHVSESFAMQQYALEKNIPEKYTRIEDQSTTTYENMLFSKKIMDSLSPSTHYHVVFSSNNFHILRADQYAKQAHIIGAQGIGSKTAKYFLPNAIIREFIALMVMHRKRHLWFIIFVWALSFLIYTFSYFI